MRHADILTFLALVATVAMPFAGHAHEQASAKAATGTLRLTIDPPSLVLIDNEEIGEVEKRSIELSVGPHRVRIVHADFQPLRRTVDVTANELIDLTIDLYDKGVPRNPGVIPSPPAGTRSTTRRGDQKPAPGAPTPPPAPTPPRAPTPQGTPAPPSAPAAESTPPASVMPVPALDAQLRVKIDPPAEVWIDGVRQGVYGEGTIAVSAGRHDVRIEHADYQPLNRRLTVTPEKPAVLDLKLADRAVPKPRPQP